MEWTAIAVKMAMGRVVNVSSRLSVSVFSPFCDLAPDDHPKNSISCHTSPLGGV